MGIRGRYRIETFPTFFKRERTLNKSDLFDPYSEGNVNRQTVLHSNVSAHSREVSLDM